MTQDVLVSPSLLSANFCNLDRDLCMINSSEADWLHLDIMDGVFVPNISFGFPVVGAVKKACLKPLDVHLMIVNPDNYVPQFARMGASVITVHYEACPHLHRSIQLIKSLGVKAGVALNPHTPVSLLEDIIEDVDLVLLMSVNPGFGGQKFINRTLQKVEALKKLVESRNSSALIEVDGGVNYQTGEALVRAGASVLVAGSFVFGSENPAETIHGLKALR